MSNDDSLVDSVLLYSFGFVVAGMLVGAMLSHDAGPLRVAPDWIVKS